MQVKIRHRFHNSSGFSLTELLAAILILGMVSSVVAGGIPVARDAYNKVTVSANAQVLLSTTISALRGQLGTARIEDNVAAGSTLLFFSGKNGSSSRIEKNASKNNEMWIQEFVEYSDPSSPYYNASLKVDSRALMPGTDDLYATYDTIAYDSSTGIVTVQGLTVMKDGVSRVTPIDLSIRVIGNPKES